jgi:hypothetical protein
LRHAPILGEVLALGVSDVLQQRVGLVVSFHRSPICRPNVRIVEPTTSTAG